MGQTVSAFLFAEEEDLLARACCDIKLVILASKALERDLEQHFNAGGRGLHEKISSAKGLDAQTVRRMRRVATVRNRILHQDGFDEIKDKKSFRSEFKLLQASLQKLIEDRQGPKQLNCAIS